MHLAPSSHLTAVNAEASGTHTEAGLANKTHSLLCKPNPQYLATTPEFLPMEGVSQELCECRHECARVCASLEWGCNPRGSNATCQQLGARDSSQAFQGTEPSPCRDPPCMDTRDVLPAANPILPSHRGAWLRLCLCGCSRCLLHLQPQSSSSLAFLRLLDPA